MVNTVFIVNFICRSSCRRLFSERLVAKSYRKSWENSSQLPPCYFNV